MTDSNLKSKIVGKEPKCDWHFVGAYRVDIKWEGERKRKGK